MTSVNRLNRMTVIAAMLIAAVAILALAPARMVRAADTAPDDEKDWKMLGDAQIEKKGGTATIDVGAEEGLVKRIKFEVRGTDVEFKKATVSYENGDPEQIDVRDKVRRGGKTRPIDLKGGNRVIKKVAIALKVDKDADRDARVILMGRK